MKKILGLMIMSLVALLPLSADAATSIGYNCNSVDENGLRTCTISYNITDAEGASSLNVKLTEQGGAVITKVENASDSDWTVTSNDYDSNNKVWNVLLSSPGVSGEGNLFTFTYQVSGETDCKVLISLNNETTPINPEPTPDTPTENEDTGATLPYIALGTIAIIAVGAYIATKNKSKMYKI